MELVKQEIDHLTRETLRELAHIVAPRCLSLYMPTHRSGNETEQDPIRLKNLLAQAEDELLAAGDRRPTVVDLLEPMQELVDNYEFWQHQSEGLAIFRTPEYIQLYRLPLPFAEQVVISERPHIKPLLPLVTTNGHFYLLALSQNQVRFWEGTRRQIGEISLDDTPTSLAEAMRFDEFNDQLQFHTQTGANTDGGRAAIFHGHSNAGDEAVVKENIKRFLNRVDDGVCDHVEDQRTPLVLAGVEVMRGLYQEVANYQTIVDAGVDGNPERLSAQELHAQAWPLVEPRFAQAQQAAVDGYLHLAGTNDARASADLNEIVAGAYFQRVDTLFVPLDVQQWGRFEPEANRVDRHDEQQTGDFDLLDFAAVHTLINGGVVYALAPEEMPGHHLVAAIFRHG
ncbi:MAG: hypothetical protein R3C14_26350 [Caldilineaceae bacterium]